MALFLDGQAEFAPGVVEGLVQGAAGRPQPLGHHVDRHLVERQRDEHLALMWGELGVDRPRDSLEQLAAFGRFLRRRRRAREPRPLLGLLRYLSPLPRKPPDLHRRLEQRELVGPRREAALAAEASSLASTATRASSALWR